MNQEGFGCALFFLLFLSRNSFLDFCFPVVKQLYWEEELHHIYASDDICVTDGRWFHKLSVLLILMFRCDW